MKRNTVYGVMLALTMISVSVLSSTLWVVQASPDTILYIEPSSVVDPALTPGSTFTVDVMISDVDYFYAWQFNMTFDPAVLRIANLIEGDFLKVHPEGIILVNKTENERGWALIGCSMKGAYIGKSGSGTLATLEFEVLTIGASPIKIETDPFYFEQTGSWVYPTFLQQQLSAFPPPDFKNLYPPDDFTTQDSYFNNPAVLVSASLDVDPNALNLRSKGRWTTAYIELPEGHDVSDIDVSTILLEDTIVAELHPTEIADYDSDGIIDLMVKFDRQDLIVTLSEGEVTLTVTGEVNGIPFEGSDTIRVIDR